MRPTGSPREPLDVEESFGLLEVETDKPTPSHHSFRDRIRNGDTRQLFKKWTRTMLALLRLISSLPWLTYLTHAAWFLAPSFLQGKQSRAQFRRAALHPTAYLDGMRGVASFAVFIFHYSLPHFNVKHSWGYDGSHHELLRLPIIRLAYQGSAAVAIFFVISGYALSYKPLKLLRQRKVQDFSTTMSSLTFRRLLRLYAPPAVSSLMMAFMIQSGALSWQWDYVNWKLTERKPPGLPRTPYLSQQLEKWAWYLVSMLNIFAADSGSTTNLYDDHLWTIPIEYRDSLLLFMVITGTARLRTAWRYGVLLVTAAVSFRLGKWDFVLFLAGMALAEWDHIRGAHITPPGLPVEEKKAGPAFWLRRGWWHAVAALGLFFMSYPAQGGDKTPGFIFLTSLTPEWWGQGEGRIWLSLGAVIFTLAVAHLPIWRRIFNSTICQYLAKISYSLYLIHAMSLSFFIDNILKWAWYVTGREGAALYGGFLLGSIFTIPITIWFADVFWRLVDIPVVDFAKWVESKLIVSI